MDPSREFVPITPADVAQEDEDIAEMMEEGLPSPPSNPIHFYVDNEDVDDLQEEELGSQDPPPTQPNISTFLRLPQQDVPTHRSILEPLVDYSQSQILTSNDHVSTLESIAQKKIEVARERERKKIEKEYNKSARELEKQKKIEAKEKRAQEREAKRMGNSVAAILAQEEARKQFKAKWTITACEEAGQKLHDLIKLGGDIFNKSPYLGRQPLVCKRNQQIAMAKVKAKQARKKMGHLCQLLNSHCYCHTFMVCERTYWNEEFHCISSDLLNFPHGCSVPYLPA